MARHLLVLAAVLGLTGCKVGLLDVAARFTVSDAAWFAEEETLFVFWEMSAEQGLGDDTVIELTYTTDDGVVDWQAIDTFETVHTHLPVDCGANTRCGSTSIHVPRPPRSVGVRLRYHRAGDLTLDPETRFNVVGLGPPHLNRSLLVYGVFTENNRAVQWRARHRFPTLRNEEVQRLGLRRRFVVDDMGHGAVPERDADNPYLYGVACPTEPLGWATTETDARAVFSPEDLPDAALASAGVCAQATVFDPTGPFTTTAVAHKNPEVRPAFPVLRSPIREAKPLKYLISVCSRTISTDHRNMQIQRLLMEGVVPFCIDDLDGDDLVDALVARLGDDIEEARAEGVDLVLALALHHDDAADVNPRIEAALRAVLVPEQQRNTPRVVGAFLLDSYLYTVADSEVGAMSLWCPANVALAESVDLSTSASLVCALPPADLNLTLGPFDIGTLPILPDRSKYLNFLDRYSERQAGQMKSLTFRAPELPPGATSQRIPPLGTATFFNDEVLTAERDHVFSFCQSAEAYAGVVFRTSAADLLPISLLPTWHLTFGMGQYPLGLVWDFPFQLKLEYVQVGALAVGAFGASLPFGIGTEINQDYGSTLWETGEFPLSEALLQCTRHCLHPTFDAGGVYQVNDLFRDTYMQTCYRPHYPERGDGGFPRDP